MLESGNPNLALWTVGGLVLLWGGPILYSRYLQKPAEPPPSFRFGPPSYGKAFAELAAVHEAVINNYHVPIESADLDSHSYFRRVTQKDARAIADLGQKHKKVFVSVVSEFNVRSGYTSWNRPVAQGPFLLSREGLKGITKLSDTVMSTPRYGYSGKIPDDIPQDGEMTDGALGFFRKPALEPGATWPSGRWEVTLAPIRADSEDCVKCHNQQRWEKDKLRTGDIIGLAMYSYPQGTF